jgi:thiosulfate/3-mercaptopyruvate sulfurtransferase
MSDISGGLVSTGWLAERLGQPGLRILDASWHMPATGRDARAEFAAGHIPGAQFFDIDDIADQSSPLPHMLPEPADFARHMQRLGIGDGDQVVVYDVHGLMSAARAWWTLRAFGHDEVAVLDGGLPLWLVEQRPVETGPAAAPPAAQPFTARYQPALVRGMAEVEAVLASGREQLVDARAADRFEGTAPEPRAGLRSGHMPGARNLPFGALIDPATRRLLPPDAIAARFRAAGIDLDRPVIASCGSGITACVLAFGLHLTGKRDVAVYDGSWTEWAGHAANPVVAGPA